MKIRSRLRTMDYETRENFKRKLEEMIEDATKNEQIARDIQDQVEQKRAWVEMLSESGSRSRSRRNKEKAADVETQITELDQQAARQWEIVRDLWNKIREIQEEERSS